MEIIESKNTIMKNAVEKINKELGLFKILYYLNYYLLTKYLSVLSILFMKQIKINKLVIKNETGEYTLKFPVMTIQDTGIFICNSHVPYENIIKF